MPREYIQLRQFFGYANECSIVLNSSRENSSLCKAASSAATVVASQVVGLEERRISAYSINGVEHVWGCLWRLFSMGILMFPL